MATLTPRQYSRMAQERSRLSSVATKRLHEAAWRRIVRSRRFIRLPIAGGSTSSLLNEKVRATLRAGTLPLITFRTWAGAAPGTHSCACCGLLIAAGEPEYEPQAAPGLYAHLACFPVWHMESSRLERRDRPGTAAAGA